MPKKTPSKDEVLEYLRREYECDINTACLDTEEIANHFGCHPKSLYNEDKDSGVLYELWQDGYIRRETGCREGEWQWEAEGGEMQWNWA